MIRQPAVAGLFYDGSARDLKRRIEGFLPSGAPKEHALGAVVPHAGYQYSGAVAGAVYSRIELTDTIVLIGPNHTGLGAPVSVMAEGRWTTPLGETAVDSDFAGELLNGSPLFRADSLAHLQEHSLEVQLPFIQFCKRDAAIVPVQLMDVRLETCREVGRAVAAAINKSGRRTLVLASSDMSHYVDADTARRKDQSAIGRILALDPEGLYRVVRTEGISMCGFGPAVAMLTACLEQGAAAAELVKYANSGEASGDFDRVVGYAGIIVR